MFIVKFQQASSLKSETFHEKGFPKLIVNSSPLREFLIIDEVSPFQTKKKVYFWKLLKD